MTLINDRYETVRSLGQGAFGQTLLARDKTLNRDVAIKLLHPHRADNWKSYEMFEREAKVLHSLRHHGVPEVYEVFRAPFDGVDSAFLVMEYVEGTSLASMIEESRHLDPADVTHIFLELLGVLDYLHGRVPPILHRDIKPANIIIRPNGFPALVDFGAVRSAVAPAGESGSTIVGTYGYMPYEQHMGLATPSSDLYALAATFLHLLTGRTPPEFMNAEGRLEVPASVPGGGAFQQVLSRMLRPAPSERYQSARDVRQALSGGTHPSLPVVSATSNHPTRPLPTPLVFSPAPRELDPELRKRFEAVAPNMFHYLDGEEKPLDTIDAMGIVSVVFFSLITAGVLPLILGARAKARRKRLKMFFRHGTPAIAEITAIQDTTIEFKLRLTRVRYEFDVDGALHRDTDHIVASAADKWRPGDKIEILYLPDRNYDSVIISVR